MQKFIKVLSFLLLSYPLICQTVPLPYSDAEGWLGLSDPQGKIIIEPQYQSLQYIPDLALIKIKKKNLWGVMNYKGEVLIEPEYSDFNLTHAFKSRIVDGEVLKRPMLAKFVDANNNIEFYLHHSKPKKDYSRYVDVNKALRNIPKSQSYYNHGAANFIKVALYDNSIQFLDTLGEPIFKEPVFDAYIYNDKFIQVKSEKERCALFSESGEQLTPFKYKLFRISSSKDYIIATLPKEEGASRSKQTILNIRGKEIFTPHEKMDFQKARLIINDSDKASVYALNGDLIFEEENATISRFDYVSEDVYKINRSNKLGIMDAQGSLLLDTIYKTIEKAMFGRYVFTNQKNSSGLLDSNFQTLFKVDYPQIKKDNKSATGYFIIRKDLDSYTYGLVDSTGKLVLQPEYRNVQYYKACNFIQVKGKKDSIGLFNLQGKELLAMQPKTTRISCRNTSYLVSNTEWHKEYTLDGELLGAFSAQRPKKIKRVDDSGKEYTDAEYSFFSNTDTKTNRLIWFGRKKNKLNDRDHFNVIFNDRGKEISPPGYGLPENYTYNKTGVNGGIRVAHIEDAIKRSREPRQGIIDFEGNWLVKPEKRTITVLGSELFLLGDFETKKISIHNRYGKKLSDAHYDFFEDDPNNKILKDRIVVGKMQNREDYLGSISGIDEITDMREMIKIMDKMEKPKYLKGYINSEGEEVIPLIYTEAEPFQYIYTTVSGIDKSGKSYSNLIDINNKVLLHTDYDNLKVNYSDTTLLVATRGNQKGIIDLSGKVIIDLSNTEVQYTKGLFTSADSTGLYLHVPHQSTKHRIGDHGDSWKINPLSKSFYHLKVTTKHDASPYYTHTNHVFDTQGNSYDRFVDLLEDSQARLDTKIYGLTVPDGYVVYYASRNASPYVVEIASGKEFKKKD